MEARSLSISETHQTKLHDHRRCWHDEINFDATGVAIIVFMEEVMGQQWQTLYSVDLLKHGVFLAHKELACFELMLDASKSNLTSSDFKTILGSNKLVSLGRRGSSLKSGG